MSKLAAFLGIYAAGVATYLLVTQPWAASAGPGPSTGGTTRVADAPQARLDRRLLTEARDVFRREAQPVLRDIKAKFSRLDRLHESMGEELVRAQEIAEGAAQANAGQLESLQEQLKKLAGLNEQAGRIAALDESVKGLLDRVIAVEKRPAVIREVVKEGPAAPVEPKSDRPQLPVEEGPDPAQVQNEIATGLANLQSDELHTLVRGIEAVRKHKVMAAVPRLLTVLSDSKHDFARQATAAALGDMKACDAMEALADALIDSAGPVAQQANRAIRNITGFDAQLSPTARIRERRRARTAVYEWWRAHEDEVRARLGQPKADSE